MNHVADPAVNRADISVFENEEQGSFQRGFREKQLLMSRRYAIGIMLFFAIIIQVWRFVNNNILLIDTLLEECGIPFSSDYYWKPEEAEKFKPNLRIAEAFAQIPAALLIFSSSSHKYLSASVAVSSILHMSTPMAWRPNSWSLTFVIYAQGIVLAPLRIAVLSVWKYWAPPAERTKLLMLSFSGIFISLALSTVFYYIRHLIGAKGSFYLSGGFGLVWSIIWEFAIFETPYKDPLITESEYLYLQCNIPAAGEETKNLLEVPWKRILASKPVWTLALVYFKIAFSLSIISEVTFNIMPRYTFISFAGLIVLIPALILLAVTCLGNYVCKGSREEILSSRKSLLCTGFCLHTVLMCGMASQYPVVRQVFYYMSYFMALMISIPGFITLALELSGPYISLVGGIVETGFCLGQMLCTIFKVYVPQLDAEPLKWFFMFDGLLSTFGAVLFFLWGSNEEQLWALTSTHRKQISS